MVFTSWEFVFFLPLVLLAYYIIPKSYRRHVLLAASYFFYGWWNWKFLGLILFTTVLDFQMGKLIGAAHGANDPRAAKRWITVSVALNLFLLGFFKYAGFFAEIVEPVATALHMDLQSAAAKIVLPLGISFYTFQSLSYTIDVYRKELPVERDFLLYALYVVYFPQLVAGPIERSTRLIPQLRNPSPVTFADVQEGIGLMLLGFFKKVAVATVVAREANRIFGMHAIAKPDDPVAPVLLLASLYLFTVQIYMDFSGYTDIARGLTRFFGIDLMKNFDQPYLSTSLTEFWKRWHISLSSWFRDYLYAPLKGKRRGEKVILTVTIVTMTIAGLWHGASWAFIFWGLYHGVFLAIERLWNRFVKRHLPEWMLKGRWVDFVLWLYVTNILVFTMAFFRSPSLHLALTHVTGAIGSLKVPDGELNTIYLAIGAFLGTLLIQMAQRATKRDAFFLSWPKPLAALWCGIMMTAIIYWSDQAGEPFIYFQF
jgi:alginate O-acetyltransferase complex protein AlgI